MLLGDLNRIFKLKLQIHRNCIRFNYETCRFSSEIEYRKAKKYHENIRYIYNKYIEINRIFCQWQKYS